MKLRFLGEGPDDVGRRESAGIVQIYVRRLMEAALKQSPDTSGWETGMWIRKHSGTGLEKKTYIAIKEAHREGFDGIVFVVDRDGKKAGGDRLTKLREGKKQAASEIPLAAVVGIAIETIEAWLLADENALSHVNGTTVKRQPDPETLDGAKGTPRHPKVVLQACMREARTNGLESGEIKRLLAERAALDVVEARCAAGFGRFAEEVRQELCARGE